MSRSAFGIFAIRIMGFLIDERRVSRQTGYTHSDFALSSSNFGLSRGSTHE